MARREVSAIREGGAGVGQDREFIRAILEEPEDDAPRLIYADWLEEQGRPERAELIRLQLDRSGGAAEVPERRARERELVQIVEGQLEDELPLRGVVFWGGVERGMIARAIWPDVKSFVEEAGQMWEAAPVVRVGFLRLRPEDFALLERSPWFDHIRDLDLGRHPEVAGEATKWLASLAPRPRLSGLRLDAAKLGDEAARHLARAGGLRVLEGLDLSLNKIGDEGLVALSESGCFPRLRRLHLGRNPLGKRGIKALADSERFPELRELRLNETGLTLDAALSLAESRGLRQLERLDLGRNRLSESAIGPLRARFGEALVT